MRSVFLVLLTLLPFEDYEFVRLLQITREKYRLDEQYGLANSDTLHLQGNKYELVTSGHFNSFSGLVRTVRDSSTKIGLGHEFECIFTDGEIRFVFISQIDSSVSPIKWSIKEYYFSDELAIEDHKEFFLGKLPVSPNDSVRMFRYDNEVSRTILNPDWQKEFIQSYSWLTDAVNEHLSE